ANTSPHNFPAEAGEEACNRRRWNRDDDDSGENDGGTPEHVRRDAFAEQRPAQEHSNDRIDVGISGHAAWRAGFQQPDVGAETNPRAEDDQIAERPERTWADLRPLGAERF